MKIADLREAAMEWTVTIEGQDEYGDVQRAQLQIKKDFDQLTSGEIGLSINDGRDRLEGGGATPRDVADGASIG